MSTTTVVLNYDGLGLCVPSVKSVPLARGEHVTFTAAQGVNAMLYFSPATAAILSPAPGASVSLSPGQSATYKVSSVGAEVYGVYTQSPQLTAPKFFDFGPPQHPAVLVIEPGMGGIGFSVASGPPQTGG
jgi:hypothetical protein